MEKVWNDVNLPGFSKGKGRQESEVKFVSGVENESAVDDTPPDPEVKILKAEWVEGPQGFQYNAPCYADVTVEFLKETIRKKLTAKLFGIYDGKEEDMSQIVQGFIDEKTNIARIEINKLWFVNNEYYYAWQKTPSTPCQYILKNISHSRGANTIDSPKLDMPPKSKLFIERLYHDNDPVQEARFEVAFADATSVTGQLDNKGTATVENLDNIPEKIRFKPDARKYEVIKQPDNPDFLSSFAKADADAIVNKASGGKPVPPQKKSMILDSVKWICGTLQGNFNQKQTVSQIVVDAVIGMIPVVGDVTAVRDITAVTIGLSLDEQKRNDKKEWVTLVILLLALIPIAGGAIKGIGKLLLAAGENAAKIEDLIHALNRLGVGDAVKYIKELDLVKYTSELMSKWNDLIQRLEQVIESAQSKLHSILSKELLDRLDAIRTGLAKVKSKGEQMIPDAIKELQERLKNIQQQVYEGEWIPIPKNLKSKSREIEARLIETPAGKKWAVDKMEFPPNDKSAFVYKKDWPDLTSAQYHNNKFRAIEAFNGKMSAEKIIPGKKIRRILDDSNPNSKVDGLWWFFVEDMPKNGTEWRDGFAVLEDWSKNGSYIEFTIPEIPGNEQGLLAWKGNVSGQIQNDVNSSTYGQYLRGGKFQLLIDFENPQNKKYLKMIKELKPVPTNWGKAI